MSYTYTQYIAAIANEAVITPTDPNFVAFIPTLIDQAEQRCYRELDLLSTIVRDQSSALTANSRNFTLPSGQGRFVTTQGFNVFTPVSTTTTRNQLVPTTRDYIDNVWPSETAPTTPSIPSVFGMITDQTIIVGPAPDAAYTVEVIGTIRPAPLSVTNTTTFLSLYLPDLFFAAGMIAMVGFQQNFGSQSDNPQMSVSWQSQYDKYLASALVEELRKKWQSVSWSSQSPSPIATPPRN